MNCTVEECPNEEQDARGLCEQHLKRFIAGLVYENEAGKLVDHCVNDHELVGDNVRFESAGRNGRRRRRCRECLRIKARNRASSALPVVDIPVPYRPNDLTLTRAIEDFEQAQEDVDGFCKGKPEKWMDYEDEDEPSKEEAAQMCDGCPLQKACANFAIAARMPHGVWGGIRIRDGKVLI